MADKQIHLLLIEDNPDDAKLIQEMLEKAAIGRFDFVNVNSFSTGLKHLTEKQPDVILLDLGLQGNQGFDALTNLYNLGLKVPIVVLTGLDDESGGLTAIKKGAQDYLIKGKINGSALCRVVNYAIERENLAKELRESETKYHELVEGGNDGIILIRDGKIEVANSQIVKMVGSSLEEMLGKPFIDFVASESRNLVMNRYKMRMSGETVSNKYEIEVIDNNGKKIPVEISASLIKYHGQTAEMAIIRDITERKRAEATLSQSENKYGELTESISDVFFAMDNELRYTHWNKASEELTGVPATGAIGRSFSDIFPKNETTRNLMEIYLKAIRTQQSQHFISEYPGGQNIIHEITVYPSKEGISVFVKDITKRMQAEEKLRESELRFRTLLEKAPVAISVSRYGKVLYANQKLVELMRESNPEKNIGRPITDFLIPELREESQTRSQLRSSGLPAPENFESKILRADGSQIPVQIQVSKVQLSDGMANIYFITDISARKKSETDLLIAQAKQKQLEEKAEINSRLAAVGEMAAGIAHEINNPLTSVLGFSQLLLEKQNIPEDIKEDLGIIADGSRRVSDIIKRLLTFARQTKPIQTLTNLNELIDNTIKLREYVLKTANIEVVTRFDPELPWSVIDPGQMQQVFLNLIVNAEQAMKKAHEKGTLTITSEKKKNNIHISFQDNGPGITRQNMKHLFEPFFTTKEVGDGTGLGLSLSRSIVLEHGGTMIVESEFGHGASFIIELPIVESPPVEITTSNQIEVQPPLEKSGRILVVDDEPGVRALLEKVLIPIGYKVDTITNAKIAMDKLDAGEIYDVILLDIRMPGMSGVELYSHIVEKIPVLKGRVIIVTGDVMGSDVKAFLTQNSLPYLTKPFDIKLLKETIDTIVKIERDAENSTS